MEDPRQSLDTLQHLLKLQLITSFGPFGQNTLVESTTGGYVLPSSKSVLLESLSSQHPMIKLVLGTASRRRSCEGDGSSSLLLCLAEGIVGVHRCLERGSVASSRATRIRLAGALAFIRRHFLERIVYPELGTFTAKTWLAFDANSEHAETNRHESMLLLVRQVCECVLCGRFSTSESQAIVELVTSILMVATVSYAGPVHPAVALRTVVDEWDWDVHEIVGAPLSRSCVLPGLLMPLSTSDQKHNAECWLKATVEDVGKCTLMLLDTSDKQESGNTTAGLQVQSGMDISRLLARHGGKLADRVATLAAGLGTRARCVALSSSMHVSAALQEACHRHNVLLLPCAGGRKSLLRIAEKLGLPVFSSVSCDPTTTVGSFRDLLHTPRIVTLGQKSFLHLAADNQLPSTGTPMPVVCRGVCNVIVCAMAAPLCRLCSEKTKTCLQALQTCFDANSEPASSPQVPNGESQPLSSRSSEPASLLHNSPWVEDACSAHPSGLCSAGAPAEVKSDTWLWYPVSTVPGGGYAELVLSHLFVRFSETWPPDSTTQPHDRCPQVESQGQSVECMRDAFRIIGHALAAVPQALHSAFSNLPHIHSQDVDNVGAWPARCRYVKCYAAAGLQLRQFNDQPSAGGDCLPSLCAPCTVLRSGALVRESLASNCRLLEQLLDLLVQLLRIDGILHTPTAAAISRPLYRMQKHHGSRQHCLAKSRLRTRHTIGSDTDTSDGGDAWDEEGSADDSC